MLRLLLFGEQFAVLSKEDLLYGLVRYIVVLYLQIFNGHKIIFFSKSQLRVYSSLDVHLNVFVLKRVHLLNYQIPEFNGPKHNYSSNDYKTVDGLYQWALINMALSGFRVMHLSAAIPGGGIDPGDIRGKSGNSAGFADFSDQFLAWDGGIGLLLHSTRQDTRGKTGGICNIAAILKIKDPDRGKWVHSLV